MLDLSRTEYDTLDDAVFDLYLCKNMSCREVGNMLGCSRDLINKKTKEMGVTRGRGGANNKGKRKLHKNPDHPYRCKICGENAYPNRIFCPPCHHFKTEYHGCDEEYACHAQY